MFTSFYGIILGTLIGGEASNVNIHVHHAIKHHYYHYGLRIGIINHQ